MNENKSSSKQTFLVLGIAFLWNETVYLSAKWIAHPWHHYDLTLPIDEFFPFVPWTVVVYFGCYLFWGVNYYLAAKQDHSERDRFFCADILSKAICLLLFLLLPTTNVRPDITGNTVWDTLMAFLYKIDSPDNLFPSIHCLISWLCWIGVRKRKDISPVYRYFSLTAAIAVCLSTLTTKQHVVVDVVGGILLAELSYILAGRETLRKPYSALISRLTSKRSR